MDPEPTAQAITSNIPAITGVPAGMPVSADAFTVTAPTIAALSSDRRKHALGLGRSEGLQDAGVVARPEPKSRRALLLASVLSVEAARKPESDPVLCPEGPANLPVGRRFLLLYPAQQGEGLPGPGVVPGQLVAASSLPLPELDYALGPAVHRGDGGARRLPLGVRGIDSPAVARDADGGYSPGVELAFAIASLARPAAVDQAFSIPISLVSPRVARGVSAEASAS